MLGGAHPKDAENLASRSDRHLHLLCVAGLARRYKHGRILPQRKASVAGSRLEGHAGAALALQGSRQAGRRTWMRAVSLSLPPDFARNPLTACNGFQRPLKSGQEVTKTAQATSLVPGPPSGGLPLETLQVRPVRATTLQALNLLCSPGLACSVEILIAKERKGLARANVRSAVFGLPNLLTLQPCTVRHEALHPATSRRKGFAPLHKLDVWRRAKTVISGFDRASVVAKGDRVVLEVTGAKLALLASCCGLVRLPRMYCSPACSGSDLTAQSWGLTSTGLLTIHFPCILGYGTSTSLTVNSKPIVTVEQCRTNRAMDAGARSAGSSDRVRSTSAPSPLCSALLELYLSLTYLPCKVPLLRKSTGT